MKLNGCWAAWDLKSRYPCTFDENINTLDEVMKCWVDSSRDCDGIYVGPTRVLVHGPDEIFIVDISVAQRPEYRFEIV